MTLKGITISNRARTPEEVLERARRILTPTLWERLVRWVHMRLAKWGRR